MKDRAWYLIFCSGLLAGCGSDVPVATDEGDDIVVEISYVDEYSEPQVWSLLEPACLSNGIGPERCRCLMNEVVAAWGFDAAAWLGMSMLLHESPAAALHEKIGAERADGAGILFEEQQHDRCSNAAFADDEEDEQITSTAVDAGAHEGEAAEEPQ